MLAAVAAGFASCSIREMSAPEAPANRVSITVNAGLEQTKTVFGAPENGVIPVTWAAEGEQLVLFEIADGVSSQSDTAEVYTLENGGANAKFQFAFAAGSAASYDYYALYPASARRAVKAGNYGVNNQVTDFAWPDAFQKSTADGPDPNHCLFMSTLKGQTAQPSELNMKFQHMCGYGKVAIKDLKLVNGEKAESLTLTFENDTVVGRYGLMPDGSMKLEAGAAKAIKIDLDAIAPEGGNFAAWFAAKPFTFNAGDKATVIVMTNKRSFTKEITATADLSFEAGTATAFTVDMSTAEAPDVIAADKELVFDFSTATATLPSWPTAAANVDGEYVYPLDGVDYSFYLYKTCAAAAQITVYNAGSAVGLPVIQGHKLVAVICSSAKGKTSYKGSISSDKGGTQVVKGGETQNWTAPGNYTYKLEETAADTRYWIYGVGPLPINKIILYYDKDGETPAGPQPYEYPEVKLPFKPINNIMASKVSTAAAGTTVAPEGFNGTFENGKAVLAVNDTLSMGGTILVGGGNVNAAAATLGTQTPFCSCIVSKGWDVPGGYVLYSTPLPYEISGDVEVGFSISSTAFATLGKWEVNWSTDGENFKPVDNIHTVKNGEEILGANAFKGIVSTHAVCRQVASIKLDSPVAAGKTFYLKVTLAETTTDASKTVRVNVGFVIYPKVGDTEFPTGAGNILFAENFSAFNSGLDVLLGTPLYYFNSINMAALPKTFDNGLTATANIGGLRGCVYANGTEAEYFTLPSLSSLTEPTDVMVTFKAGLFVGSGEDLRKYPDGLSVAVDGGGEVSALEWDTKPETDYYHWHIGHALIKGATAATQIKIGNTEGVADGSHFLLDDIVVTK